MRHQQISFSLGGIPMRREKIIPQYRWKHRWTKIMALTLVFALLIPSSALAFPDYQTQPEKPKGGLCVHHPKHTEACGGSEADNGSPCTHEHDESCGYSAPSEGSPCTHEHDENCGYTPGTEEIPCDKDCAETDDTGAIIHSPDCAYTPATEGTPCTHEHDENCGYSAPSEGSPCTHEHDENCGYVPAEKDSHCSYVCDLCVTDWQWDDPEELLVWNEDTELWCLGLPGASEENAVTSETLAAMLPEKVTATTAAGERTVELIWDLDALPEEGISEGSYTLTAALDGDYVLTEAAPALSVLVDAGGVEVYDYTKGCYDDNPVPQVPLPPDNKNPTHKFVNNWSYVIPTGGAPITNNGKGATGNPAYKPASDPYKHDDYIYSMNVDIANLNSYTQDAQLRNAINAALPQQIYCSGYNNLNDDLGKAGFSSDKVIDGLSWGYVGISWDLSGITLSKATNGTKLTIFAEPISNTSYLLRVNTNDTGYKDDKDDKADTAEAYDILNLTITLRDYNPANHIATAAKPGNVNVNLFDYWVKTETPTTATNGDILDKSDNHKHMDNNEQLTPSPTGFSNDQDWDKGINKDHLLLFGDGLIHAGLWNKGAGENCEYGKKYAGMEGIVKNVLNADGYPEINLENASKILTSPKNNPERDPSTNVEKYTLIKDYKLAGDHDNAQGTDYASLDGSVQNLSNTVINRWESATGQTLDTGTESLQYLFDPAMSSSYKKSYTNVTGLFQLDKQGYYYYNMRNNFAEFSQVGGKNHFNLYDAPATSRTDNDNSIGNFFPFNTSGQVFNRLSDDGRTLASSVACSRNEMNHHLGMTVNVDFRQPLDGTVNTGSNAQPMTFQFSGDDDVWVFIDDVLVLDMGGIHSEVYGIIDFASGDVLVGRGFNAHGIPAYDPDHPEKTRDLVTHTNLYNLYKAAGKTDATRWDDKTNPRTFESNTTHTLKMFYLERGNYDSSLALRFNLQPMLYQQIRKVDQNGNAVKDVVFKLYPAEITANAADSGAIACLYTDSDVQNRQPFYVKRTDDSALVTLTTGSDGFAQFRLNDDSLFNFADQSTDYYILHEYTTPSGYRRQPVDIVLHYDHATAMLSVANRWTTGAYACSVAHVTGPFISEPNSAQENGLVVAVPMLKKSGGRWYPLYGNNLSGFQTINDTSNNSIVLAALHQIKNSYADWHLSWDNANSRLYGTLSDLPGLASRYTLINPNGDIMVKYIQISPDALAQLPGIDDTDASTRYQSLQTYLQDPAHTLEATCKTIIDHGYTELRADTFIRDFRSLIYIPNERRELRVMKVDEDGKPLKGVRFGLFSDAACTVPVGQVGSTDDDGMLVFSPSGNNSTDGQANMAWADSGTRYYLREITPPPGYGSNDTVIPVVVGNYSIYADAGTPDDGVSVMASVGRLTQTMHQFAMDNDVDITLQDITTFMQTQSSDNFTLTGWQDVKLANTNVPRSMNLHYGINNDNFKLVDYGLHTEDGGEFYWPFFVTDTGFARVRVQQISAAAKANYRAVHTSDASWENLAGIDLTNLFSVLNIVLVTDQHDPKPATPTTQLTISKKVEGTGLNDADYTRLYSFKVTLTNADGTPLDGTYQYNFYGKDKWGYVSNGSTLLLHHDESVKILGLPAGTRFTVTETNLEAGWHVTPGQTITGETSEDGSAKAEFTNSTTRPVNPETPPVNPGGPPSDPKDPDPKDPPTPTPPPEYPTQLPDPNDPNSPDKITIWENGVPVTYVKSWDPKKEMWVYIPENMIPLSYIPDTGDPSPLWLYALVVLLTGPAAIKILHQKEKQER